MDWQNLDSWENFETTLRDMGVVIDSQLHDKIQKFTNDARIAANAISQIDPSKLAKAVQPIQKIIGDIRSGSQERVFDESAYNTIIAANQELANDFQQTLSGEYVYIGGAMSKLQDALNKNTEATLNEAAAQLMAKMTTGNAINQAISNGDITKQIIKSTGVSSTSKRQALKDIQNIMITEGVDFAKIGIAGFSAKSQVLDETKFTDEEIQGILNALYEIATNVEGFRSDYTKEVVGTKAIQYQALPAAMNAQVASRLAQQMDSGKYTDEDTLEMLARVRAIGAQAATAGVSSKMLSEYSVAVNNLNDAITRGETDLTKYIEKVASLSNAISTTAELETANAKWKAHLETMSELVETYNKLQDKSARLSIAQKMADAFGLDATAENYEKIAKLMEQYISGSFEAYQELMMMATGGTSKISEEMYNALSAYGLVIAELNEAGEIIYRMRTAAELGGTTELAGTKWTNPYDWMYMMNKRTNALIREREQLERQYQRVLESSNVSARELTELNQAQLAIELQRAQAAEERIAKAQAEAKALIAASGYADYVTFDALTGMVMPKEGKDLDGLGQSFEDFVTKLEDLGKEIEEAQVDLDEINDNVAEIQERGRDEYLQLEEAVKDALISQYEREIDKLEQIDTTIANTNSALLESVQKNISQLRQDRQNERTEADIAAKQTRLAYLQMDTSGANASEILSLQKEIAEAQEQYTDELIDQEIQRLEDANQIAQDQRQQQIELLRQQLQNAIDSGTMWDKVHDLIAKGITENGIKFDSEMVNLLKEANAWGAMSEEQRNDFLKEHSELAAAALSWFNHENQQAIIEKNKAPTDSVISAIEEFFNGEIPHFTINSSEPMLDWITIPSSGDNYFDINIETESLNSDYDVEQMAATIKRLILDDASYRNVNAVSQTI